MKPGKKVNIRITYVTTLESDNGVLRFVLPTTIAPRYRPTSSLKSGSDKGPKIGKAPYSLKVTVNVETASEIVELNSPTHRIKKTESQKNQAQVTLADEETELNSDFLLLIKVKATFNYFN